MSQLRTEVRLSEARCRELEEQLAEKANEVEQFMRQSSRGREGGEAELRKRVMHLEDQLGQVGVRDV